MKSIMAWFGWSVFTSCLLLGALVLFGPLDGGDVVGWLVIALGVGTAALAVRLAIYVRGPRGRTPDEARGAGTRQVHDEHSAAVGGRI